MAFWSGPKGDSGKGESPGDLHCSFCGKHQREVRKLIAAPSAWICDECVQRSAEIMREEDYVPPAPAEPAAIVQHLDDAVVGQAAAKRVLAAALSTHLRAFASADRPAGPRRVLLVGARGTGKTALLARLAAFDARLPSYLAASSRLTETGYVGENVENLLAALRRSTPRPDAAERGMLLLDGLQHLVFRRSLDGHRDISGSEVQRELVRVFDGLVAQVPDHPPKHPQKPMTPFACDRLLVIASVCVGDDRWPADDRTLRGWLVEQGLVDELVARFDAIVPVRKLSVDELMAAMERAVEPTRQLIEALGGKLRVAPDGARRLAEVAAASPDGAFALEPPLARLAERAMLESPREWLLDAQLAAALGELRS